MENQSEAVLIGVVSLMQVLSCYFTKHHRTGFGLAYLLVVSTYGSSQNTAKLLVTTLVPAMYVSLRCTHLFGPSLLMSSVLSTPPDRYVPAAVGLLGCGAALVYAFPIAPWIQRSCSFLVLSCLFHYAARSPSLAATGQNNKAKNTLTLEAQVLSSLLPSLLYRVYLPKFLRREISDSENPMTLVSLGFFSATLIGGAVGGVILGGGRIGGAVLLSVIVLHYAFVSWMYLDLKDPLTQLLTFVFHENHYAPLGYLGAVLVVGVAVPQTRWFQQKLTLLVQRKWFHYIATILFTPFVIIPAWSDNKHGLTLLRVAFPIVLGVFLLIEYIRVDPMFPSFLRGPIDSYLRTFADSRDDGIIRTHWYLLLGCAVPFLLHPEDVHSVGGTSNNSNNIHLLSGIVALGILDSTAA
eukprot:PhF_6_TR3695/c0_g1_i2/m.5263/K00902/E2.7.1.108; dolichol kinase